MTLPENILLLLSRQWTGEMHTEVEQSILDEWLAIPGHAEEADRLHRLWLAADSYPSHYEPDPETGWNQLKARMSPPAPARKRPAQVLPLSRWMAAAAAVLLLAAAGIWWLLPAPPAEELYRTVSALSGKPVDIVLPDGSLVLLQDGSELTFPENFPSKGHREVVLSGEAYFKVAHDEQHPFRVRSGYALTDVLGTTFNVRAWPEEAQVEVTVETGKVQLSSATQPRVAMALTPGERGQCTSGGDLTKANDEEVNALSWMTGRLRFRKTPLSEALQAIERHYEVILDLENAQLEACTYTGSFENAPLKDVLLTIELTYGTRASQASENRYVLRGGACR